MRTAQCMRTVAQDMALQGAALQELCGHQPCPQALLSPSRDVFTFSLGFPFMVEEIHLHWLIQGPGGISCGKLHQDPAVPLLPGASPQVYGAWIWFPHVKAQPGSQSTLKSPHLHSPAWLMWAAWQPGKCPE